MWRADFRQNNQIQQILPDHFVQYDENKISRKYLHFPIDKSIYLCYNIYGNKGESENSSTQRADRPPKKFSTNLQKTLDKWHYICYNSSTKREREEHTMAKVKMICFDMDGTIADLYGVNGWLDMLREENPTPYEVAEPMWDMAELHMVLKALQMQGVEIRVITWLAMESTEDYKAKTRKAKVEWLEKYGFPYNKFHGIAYGTTKANCIRQYLDLNEQAILIDDNDKIRQGWTMGETINPTKENIIEILKNLLN